MCFRVKTGSAGGWEVGRDPQGPPTQYSESGGREGVREGGADATRCRGRVTHPMRSVSLLSTT